MYNVHCDLHTKSANEVGGYTQQVAATSGKVLLHGWHGWQAPLSSEA
jgi:hypothetical protein